MSAGEVSGAGNVRPATPGWLATLPHRLRPREGWLVLVLALTAVLTLPVTAATNGLIVGLEPTVALAIVGLLVGGWLGHRRLNGVWSATIAAGLGVAFVLWWGVRVLSFVPLATQVWGRLAWWLTPQRAPDQSLLQSLIAARATPAPPLTYFADQAAALTDFGHRVWWWVAGIGAGEGVADNLVLIGLACLVVWGVSAWAGWWIARHGRPFVALTPVGVLLAQQVYAADAGHYTLLTFLAASTGLLIAGHLARHTLDWERTATDYSPEIRNDALLIGVVLAGLVVLLSPTIPFVTSGELTRRFWELFESPYRDIEDRLGASFRGAQAGRSLVPPMGVATGGMPRAHLLGGSPDLGKEVALRVQTRGARPGEPIYWRGQTFATYTGRGWENSEETLTEMELASGQPWAPVPPLAERRSVLARVEVVQATRAVLYGAGEPISVDRPYRALIRAPGELVALSVAGGRTRTYNVLGGVLDQDPELLRLAGSDYPTDPAFGAQYLQLPEGLSDDLTRYVEEVTSGAETPYDRAVALEAALRKIPYSLDVPAPPPDVEAAAWFLFDLQRGYCDYYATTMVVLARLAGIPARLAVGYATGDYDPEADRYVVTELAAHSWPELYFPGFGWAPFEPTAARETPERIALEGAIPPWMRMPGGMDIGAGLSTLQQVAEAERRSGQASGIARWSVLGLLVIAAAVVSRTRARVLRPAPSPDTLESLFDRLVAYGERLGSPADAGSTPREYVESLRATAGQVAETAFLFRGSAEAAATTVRREAERLGQAFEKATYAPEATETMVTRFEAAHDWSALWAALRRLALSRWRGRGA